MIIFIDENMAPVLARGFDILQQPLNHGKRTFIEVRSIKEFGDGVEDEVWIRQTKDLDACVITQDYNINRIKHQRQLCIKYGLGMFYFRPPSKVGFSYWDMLQMLVKHWLEIIEKASRQKRPFSYKVTNRSKRLESMDI